MAEHQQLSWDRDVLHVPGIDLYLLKHAERHRNIAVREKVIALKRGKETVFSTGFVKIKERVFNSSFANEEDTECCVKHF